MDNEKYLLARTSVENLVIRSFVSMSRLTLNL